MVTLLPVRLPIPRRFAKRGRKAAAPGRRRAAGPFIGVDLIAVSRVRQVFAGRDALLKAVFTAEELRYCLRQKNPFLHLAARYAAKEAAVKGLGTGMTGTMSWRDVETVHGPLGEPRLVLHGEVARLAEANGLHRLGVSLSHAGNYAMAAVFFTG
ncbi:MAG TPA: holo-ACP synthase [Candidatus Methylomirabilis sp.]|nr:holo-ACP synthase [Candidatus Methylomirabilis sp.]